MFYTLSLPYIFDQLPLALVPFLNAPWSSLFTFSSSFVQDYLATLLAFPLILFCSSVNTFPGDWSDSPISLRENAGFPLEALWHWINSMRVAVVKGWNNSHSHQIKHKCPLGTTPAQKVFLPHAPHHFHWAAKYLKL